MAAEDIQSANPVILNLFQDPSGLVFRRWGWMSNVAVALLHKGSARAAKWILKQVQDDDIRYGIV